jgi:hypothetical protein
VTSEKDDEQYHLSYNFKWKIQRRRCTVATHSNDSDRYAFEFKRLQFPVRLGTRKHKDIATSVWTKFGKSMLLKWTTVCGLLTRWKTDLFVYTPEEKTKNIVYSKALQ